jgi:DNA replication protein DnaC
MSRGTESRTATAYARLREHLAYLGLSTVSDQLAAELERASAETAAPVEVLERLLAAEVEATSARRLSGRLRFAHYPLDKRLSQFEFDFQPSIDRAIIAELSTLRFVEERRNALFLGPPGVGKSHLAIALGIAATEAGYRTYFTTAADLVAALTAEVHERWDPDGLYATVLESQRARRLTYDALARGRRTPWEYQPNLHPRPYVTGAADLTDLEHRRRFPPPAQ